MNMLFYRIHAIHETSLLALTCILIFSHWCTCYYIQFKWSRVGLLMRGRPWNISLMCLKHRFNNQVVIRRHTWCRMAVFFTLLRWHTKCQLAIISTRYWFVSATNVQVLRRRNLVLGFIHSFPNIIWRIKNRKDEGEWWINAYFYQYRSDLENISIYLIILSKFGSNNVYLP